jgi:hypothetical protein
MKSAIFELNDKPQNLEKNNNLELINNFKKSFFDKKVTEQEQNKNIITSKKPRKMVNNVYYFD